MKKDTVIILHNIRSSHNVGSIFRTADGAGVQKIYLSGYTPMPIDRFGRKESTIAKTALGAEQTISWEQGDVFEIMTFLKTQNHTIVGVEQASGARDYKTITFKEKTVFIFGNEIEGVEEKVLALCDTVIEIPMLGGKESLNVSVAAGIILFNQKP